MTIHNYVYLDLDKIGHASTVTTMHTSTQPIKVSTERLWCCQSIGSGIVAGLSQKKSGRA
jgi:hypothetical protein